MKSHTLQRQVRWGAQREPCPEFLAESTIHLASLQSFCANWLGNRLYGNQENTMLGVAHCQYKSAEDPCSDRIYPQMP